jgi:hypothetical protein
MTSAIGRARAVSGPARVTAASRGNEPETRLATDSAALSPPGDSSADCGSRWPETRSRSTGRQEPTRPDCPGFVDAEADDLG